MTRGAKAKAQRQQGRAPAPVARRGSKMLVPGAALIVVLGGATAFALLSGDGDDGGGAAPEAPVVAPPATAPAARYQVVYRVEDTAGPAPAISTDVVAVRQPFESRLEHRQGAPPGGEVLSSTVVNQRFQFNSSRGEERFATGRIPGALPQTVSVEALEAAVEAGVAERLGPGNHSEPCTRYAYRRAGNEPLAKGDTQEKVEACITADGILVREEIVLGGRTVRVAEATDVDRDPPFTAETFLSERDPTKEPDARLLETEQVVAEGRSDASRIQLAAPEGFEVARQVTVNRQLGPNSPPVSLFVRAFTRRAELVVTEELLTPSAQSPWAADEGRPVELGANRRGRVVDRSGSTEVRVTAGGKFVKVVSPRPALALAVARTIQS
ncbi:MAG: hypothetical protein ACRD0C_08925 [Acidimicrobiia bacterium]